MIYTYNGIPFSPRKEENFDICCNLNDPWWRAKWNKPTRKGQRTVWFHLYEFPRVVRFMRHKVEQCWPEAGSFRVFLRFMVFCGWMVVMVTQQYECTWYHWTVHLKIVKMALAGVAQWIECQPANQRVAGLIPSQSTCLGCGLGSW